MHGLEHEMFTSKFKHYNFHRLFAQELHTNDHLKRVLGKIGLEHTRYSERAVLVEEAPNPLREYIPELSPAPLVAAARRQLLPALPG